MYSWSSRACILTGVEVKDAVEREKRTHRHAYFNTTETLNALVHIAELHSYVFSPSGSAQDQKLLELLPADLPVVVKVRSQ